MLLASKVSKIDSDTNDFELRNTHFERPVIDFHYFPQLFSIHHLRES